MKFKHTQEFYQFLLKAENINRIDDFKEINIGGVSYNFYLKTDLGEFLIKLLPDTPDQEIRFQRLKKTWESCYQIFPLEQENFKNYKLLLMPFFHGHKLEYQDCTPEVMSRLAKAYQRLVQNTLPADCILAPLDFADMYAKIERRLADNRLWMNHIINRFFWQKFKKELKIPSQNYQLIHGDFTVNNILIDENKEIHLIDFEGFRQGYDYEDWGSLLLQLSGYKGFFGSFKRLSYLLETWKKVNAPEMEVEKKFPQAVQMFYFWTLYKRLSNPNKRQIRKDLNLLLSLCKYFKLARQLKMKVW